MSRESCITPCIQHRAKQAIAIVRQDYYELMDRDACAAALLNLFEYWANGSISDDATVQRPWVGARPIREFEQRLLGIATDKQIRKRLALLEARGFIQVKTADRRRPAKEYRVLIPEIQQPLVGQTTEIEAPPWSHNQSNNQSNNQQHFGQITDDDKLLRSFDQPNFGQTTHEASVKQPVALRSNDRALKNKPQEFKKEDFKEARLSLASSQFEVFRQVSQSEQAQQRAIQTQKIQYAQPPKTIDLADLWSINPGMAKAKLRFIAPGHKRPEMVAHGLGQWWVGPGLNDFDRSLVKACQQRKRQCQQADSETDAKTYLNNMLRNSDWANLTLRCEEAEALKQKTAEAQKASVAASADTASAKNWSEQDRQASLLGLVQFKLRRGEIEGARAIARQVGIDLSGHVLDQFLLVA